MTQPPPGDASAPDELAAGANPPAATAGQQDHSDPWVYAGDEADPPADTGKPPADSA